jgi:hypothetical protein
MCCGRSGQVLSIHIYRLNGESRSILAEIYYVAFLQEIQRLKDIQGVLQVCRNYCYYDISKKELGYKKAALEALGRPYLCLRLDREKLYYTK